MIRGIYWCNVLTRLAEVLRDNYYNPCISSLTPLKEFKRNEKFEIFSETWCIKKNCFADGFYAPLRIALINSLNFYKYKLFSFLDIQISWGRFIHVEYKQAHSTNLLQILHFRKNHNVIKCYKLCFVYCLNLDKSLETTPQKMKFPIKDFFSKCDQIHKKR